MCENVGVRDRIRSSEKAAVRRETGNIWGGENERRGSSQEAFYMFCGPYVLLPDGPPSMYCLFSLPSPLLCPAFNTRYVRGGKEKLNSGD